MGLTDYLEEHLDNAEALLERIRRLEQSASGLTGETIPKENTDKSYDFSDTIQDTEEKSGIVSRKQKEVYDTRTKVNLIKETVDDLDLGHEICEKKQDIAVNRQIITDDNSKSPGQAEIVFKAEETGTRTNAERAENRSPLSDQLEELDRAVSALAALTPEGRGDAQSGYPVFFSAPQGPVFDPNITAVPGEAWSGPGEAWSGPGTPDGAGLAYAETQSWAEQADRIFRRDSRRFDGGFYLY